MIFITTIRISLQRIKRILLTPIIKNETGIPLAVSLIRRVREAHSYVSERNIYINTSIVVKYSFSFRA